MPESILTGEVEVVLFGTNYRPLLDALHVIAGAAEWNVSHPRFDVALFESAQHEFGVLLPPPPKAARYLQSLHVRDLALVTGCIDEDPRAWEQLFSLRGRIRAAARHIVRESAWEEVADSIFAHLYGLDHQGSRRTSPLTYYRGRSSLVTWLHSVLRRQDLDRRRETARTTGLDHIQEQSVSAVEAGTELEPHSRQLRALGRSALWQAVLSLESRDLLRFALYYQAGLQLSAVGVQLAEHASTTSRQLARARSAIRDRVERSLRTVHGLNEFEVHLCLDYLQEPDTFDYIAPLLKCGSADG